VCFFIVCGGEGEGAFWSRLVTLLIYSVHLWGRQNYRKIILILQIFIIQMNEAATKQLLIEQIMYYVTM